MGHGSRESTVSAYKMLSKLRTVTELEAMALEPVEGVAQLERYDRAIKKVLLIKCKFN